MKRLITILVSCYFFTGAFAQTDSSTNELDQIIEDNIENIASSVDGEPDYNTLIDQLHYFKEHPLDLNSATHEELESLILLNPLQAEALLKHIKENGKLIALEELQTIDG